MDRRTSPLLLLPLVAVLALIYPVTFLPQQTNSLQSRQSRIFHQTAQPDKASPSSQSQQGIKSSESHDAKKILSEFFGPTPMGHVSNGESPVRSSYKLDFLIVTIPDPIDSRLPYLFDRNLASIQRAAEADGYVLDRFDLPWIEEIRKKAPAKEDGKQSAASEKRIGEIHSYNLTPGFILFREPVPEDPRSLLLFLVGETPTGGVHKQAMISALDQIAWLCGRSASPGMVPPPDFDWSESRPPDIPLPSRSACSSIKILGPSFSGSAESLDFALHSWVESRTKAQPWQIRIVSGSATAIPYARGVHPGCFFQFFDKGSSFASAVAHDSIALNELLLYFKSQHSSASPFRVALLTEGNTAYGHSLSKAISASKGTQTSPSCTSSSFGESGRDLVSGVHVDNLPFPLHISRLRSELEKIRRENQQSSEQETPNPASSRSLPLPTEDDSENAIDSIPPVSQLDISSAELMLSNLLSTISHEQFNYVGIGATDIRDVIFLARELREHSPSTVIFALNADLLYAHPEANPNTRGMLVVSSYPLFTLNQLWMSQNPAKGGDTRIQFPDQGSEGIYNAMSNLLNPEAPLLEYGSPFDRRTNPKNNDGQDNDKALPVESAPPIWIVAVGRDGFWPVAIRSLEARDKSFYTLRASPFLLASDAKLTNRGIVPQFTHAVLILWSLVCLIPALIFLARTKEFHVHWKFADRLLRRFRSRSPVGHLFTLDYPEAKSFYLIGGTATLSAYAVAITAYFVSAIEYQRWDRWLFLAGMLLILLIGVAACVTLGSDIVRHALKSRARSVRRRRVWLATPVIGSSILCFAFAMSLSLTWIALRFFNCGDGILTGFRAVNLRNGVSPLLPLLFISLATVAWAFCSIRRLQMIEGIASVSSLPRPGSAQSTEQIRRDFSFFYSNKSSFRGLGALELQLYDLLSCPSLRFPHGSRTAVYLALVLTLFWGVYLFFYRLVYAFESRSFYILLGISFLFVYAAVLSNVLRLFFLWKALRALLQRLGQLPLRDAFSRFQTQHRTMPRMNLASAPSPLTALGVSISEARDLLNSAHESPSPLSHEIVTEGKTIVRQSKDHYECALEAAATGQYRYSLTDQLEAQRNLNRFSRLVERALDDSWGTSLSNAGVKEDERDNAVAVSSWLPSYRKEKERVEHGRKAFTDQAEKFLVSRTVHFLAHMLPQLTNLTTYSLVSLFLLLLAVSSYPLQPKNPFAYYNWFIILAFTGIAAYMAFQMNRDAVLSCLNGTKPGELHWDAEFIGRLFFLIVIPVLGFLGVQFPEVIGQLVRWLTPSGSAHP